MSRVDWTKTESRREARKSGVAWRKVETYEPNSPAGSQPIDVMYQIAVERCTHNDGLYCGSTREKHPKACSCWSEHDFT